jgi:hypothetical protein
VRGLLERVPFVTRMLRSVTQRVFGVLSRR